MEGKGKYLLIFIYFALCLSVSAYMGYGIAPSDAMYMSLPPLFLALPKNHQEIVTGNMLGDGGISYRQGVKKANARYNMTMKASSKSYMQYLLDTVYGSYCGTGLIPFPNPALLENAGKVVTQYYFASLSSPLFLAIHSLWYRLDEVTGKYIKIVPPMIVDMLTPLALAHWIMEDGYFDGYGRAQTVLLCTESFTKVECELLVSALARLGIISTLKVRNNIKGTYRVRISKKSMPLLRQLVTPHMHSDFMYKLG
jgi:hypothetical protein